MGDNLFEISILVFGIQNISNLSYSFIVIVVYKLQKD